jgi:hypothetical protein
LKIIVYKNQVREKLISGRRRNAGDENQKPKRQMKIQEIYNITLTAADSKASEQIQVGFCLVRNMGYGKQEIANEITDLRQAVRVMRAGMTDSESDRLDQVRLERTGVEYDAEQGTIAEEFSETVGDLIDALNSSDYTCTITAVEEASK